VIFSSTCGPSQGMISSSSSTCGTIESFRMRALPKLRAKFSELSAEEQERVARIEKIHVQDVWIRDYIEHALGLANPSRGPDEKPINAARCSAHRGVMN
jgi:hypothetical protein